MNGKNKLMFGMVLVVMAVLMISFNSAAYTRSVSQGTIPGLNVGSSGNLVGSDFSRELCNEAGQDFIIQIAPAGCEPTVVRSDLLEENNAQIYCPLSATKLNPLIKVEAIESITFSGDFPSEVTSVNFHPAKAALGGVSDLNSPIMENIGYVVIGLRKQSNESAMPDFVEGNLTARIRYDIQEAFGVGDASFYLPEISSEEWNSKYKQYGFWDARGYLRAESIDSDSASISIYDGSNNRLSGATLKKGEVSNKMYLPGMGLCTANFQVQLKDVKAPNTRARLKINSEIIEVSDNERFLDNKCSVKDIEKHGLVQSVELQCEEDGKRRENFNLIISPKIKLDVSFEGNSNVVEVGLGDKIPGYEIDGPKFVYVGYIGQDSRGRKFIIPVVSAAQNKEKFMQTTIFKRMPIAVDLVTYSSGNILLDVILASYNTVYGGWGVLTNYLISGSYPAGWIYEESASIDPPVEGNNEIFQSLELVQNNIKFIGYASSFDEVLSEEKDLITAYEKALEDYDKVIGGYGGEKDLSNIELDLGEQAMYSKIDLLLKFNQKQTAIELCDEFKLNYPNSEQNIEGLCEDELKIANYELSSSQVLINGKLKEISLEGIYEPSVDEYGAIVSISGFKQGLEGEDDKPLEESLKKIKKGIKYPLLGEDYFELISVDEEYIKVRFKVKESITEVAESVFKFSGKSTKIKLEESVTGIGTNKYRLFVNQINIDNVAKVSVKSNIDNVGSESSFKFKIGIEKRNIQLSPEKINKRINKLEGAIDKLEGINNNLGKVVETGKTACLATGTVLTVKNLFYNLKGKGIARQKVMRSTGGWYEICENEENEGVSVSKEKCLLDHSGEIETDIVAMELKMGKIDENMKIIQDKHKINLGDFHKGFNQEKIIEDYSKKIVGLVDGLDDSDLDEFENSLSYEVWDESKNYDLEQLKDIELYLDMSKDSSLTSEMRAAADQRFKKIVSDIEVATGDSEERVSWANNLGINPAQMPTLSIGENTKEWIYGDVVLDDGTPVQILPTTNGKKYIVILDDSAGTNILSIRKNNTGVLMIYDGSSILKVRDKILSDFESMIIIEGISEIENLHFKKYDSATYENEYEDYEVQYYETEPYKGFPAIVPFDIENGWYAAMKSTLPIFGNLASYDASPRVNSFYLCNVGKNKKQEFFSGIGDDDCKMMNLGTGQPTNQFYGLDSNRAGQLVDTAVEAIKAASDQHENGVRTIFITSPEGQKQNIPVGKPAVETPDLQCQDFMSPADCNIMFNICDPFFCPSSRCDFGGKYPVRDVIQSGVIGSTMLCLPNYDEGIAVPVCLSGIHAGVDGWNQIMKSYQDCLQTSLDTGETVGICDEIYSVYGCEFFWRQAAPLAKLAVPKTVSGILGKNSRGGGEYLDVKDAWERAGNSIDYFKESYAKSSFDAFKSRSSEEVGSVVCKASVSAVLPNGGSIIDALTKPDSPHQINGRFDEIPYTTATNPPISQYKVFYNIYAGSDSGAYYSVYLKAGTSSYYQDTNLVQTIASGYIPIGEYVTETPDKLLPSGYRELCINVNGQEYCGFKEVSTSFAVDYVKDKYLVEQASQENIQSEKECIAGTPSGLNLLNPNVQEGAGDYIDPAIYDRNIIRICATKNPGVGTDLSLTADARWKQVGYCGDQKIKCWLDSKSVEDAIKWDVNDERALKDVSDNYVNILLDEGNYTTDDEFGNAMKEINDEEDSTKKISLIDKIISRVFHNNQKGNLHYIRGNAYADLAKKLLSVLIKEEQIFESSKLEEISDEDYADSFIEDETHPGEGQVNILPVFLFQDGTEERNLYYKYFYNNEIWSWSLNKVEWFEIVNEDAYCDVSSELGCINNFETEFEQLSSENQNFINGLKGLDYSQGVKSLIDKTRSFQGGFFGFIKPDLVADNGAIMDHTGEFILDNTHFIVRAFTSLVEDEIQLTYENNLWYRTDAYYETVWRSSPEHTPFFSPFEGQNFYEGALIIFEGDYNSDTWSAPTVQELLEGLGQSDPVTTGEFSAQQMLANLAKSDSTTTKSAIPETFSSCKEEIGYSIMEIANEIKTEKQISDNDVKQDTGAESFECLILQMAMQESGIRHCKETQDNACSYCENQGLDSLLKGSGSDYGVMQINTDVHEGIVDSVDNLEAHVRYAVEDVLVKGYSDESKEYTCADTSYSGWERALRSYNGWNVDCTKGDVEYVENVETKKDSIMDLFPGCAEYVAPSAFELTTDLKFSEEMSEDGFLKVIDDLGKEYGWDSKYSKNKEIQNFIDEIYSIGVLSEKEYIEINGKGWFNFEEDLTYLKELFTEKMSENINNFIEENLPKTFQILESESQDPVINENVEVISDSVEVDLFVAPDTISVALDSTLRYIDSTLTNIDEELIVTECVHEPVERCEILEETIPDSSEFEIQNIVPADTLILEFESDTLAASVDTLVLQALTETRTDSVGEITIDSTAQILRIFDAETLEPISDLDVNIFDYSETFIDVFRTDSFGEINIGRFTSDFFDEDELIPRTRTDYINRDFVDYEGIEYVTADNLNSKIMEFIGGEVEFTGYCGQNTDAYLRCAQYVANSFDHIFGSGKSFLIGLRRDAWLFPQDMLTLGGTRIYNRFETNQNFEDLDSLQIGDVLGLDKVDMVSRQSPLKNSGENYSHVGLYLGKINGLHYVTHKIGNNIFTESIDDLNEGSSGSLGWGIETIIRPNQENTYITPIGYKNRNKFIQKIYAVQSGDNLNLIADYFSNNDEHKNAIIWLYVEDQDSTTTYAGQQLELFVSSESADFEPIPVVVNTNLWAALNYLDRISPRTDKEINEWERAIYNALDKAGLEKTPENYAMVFAVLDKESSFNENPPLNMGAVCKEILDNPDHVDSTFFRRQVCRFNSAEAASIKTEKDYVNSRFHKGFLGVGGKKLTSVGAMQININTAMAIARSEGMSSSFTEENLYHDLLTKEGGLEYGVKYLKSIIDVYAPEGISNKEEAQLIFSDYNAGLYKSRNAAFQLWINEIIKKGKSSGLYSDMNYLALDGYLGEQSMETIKQLLPNAQVSGENILSGSFSKEFEISSIYLNIRSKYISSTGDLNPVYAIIPEIKTSSIKYTQVLTVKNYAEKSTQNLFNYCYSMPDCISANFA